MITDYRSLEGFCQCNTSLRAIESYFFLFMLSVVQNKHSREWTALCQLSSTVGEFKAPANCRIKTDCVVWQVSACGLLPADSKKHITDNILNSRTFLLDTPSDRFRSQVISCRRLTALYVDVYD